jgi:hypothetical protein
MIDPNCMRLICLVSSTGALGTVGQINYSSYKKQSCRWRIETVLDRTLL